ncbi:hypothetical protein GCM10007907_30340 [Chitinimonas prasina]|uniref:Uncharacterized protein n=1 Tax=Chitinimonas prasina TaxID=1434937 RepID=A0ABQ5YHW3_9NEIS|nr:hypothetical protein [Chitinimonas prasina]GLR14244.1 hypothetical protein GCM10007907_30340 [Chitinimonas prasina]
MNHTNESQSKAGSDAALAAWEIEKAYRLFYGSINSSSPTIDGNGFYLVMSYEGESYVRAYNAAIKEMLEKYGLPAWAPKSRAVAADLLPEFRAQATNGIELDLPVKQHRIVARRCIRMLEGKNGVIPIAYLHIPEREVVLIFSEMKDSTRRCDVVDLHYQCWMQSLSF